MEAALDIVAVHDRRRWTLRLVLLGALTIWIDSTITSVALSSIQRELRVAPSSLTWLINAYLLSFGGVLLLAGRLGDVYGHRRVFLLGITVFVAASLACGLSMTTAQLIAARAVQGMGGAAVLAVTLSLIFSLFTSEAGRANALARFGFVASISGSVGLLLGAAITHSLSWRWIFFVNLPIGATVYALCRSLIPHDRVEASARVSRPLIPRNVLRIRRLVVASAVRALWVIGVQPWIVITALYLQLVLEWNATLTGMALLPPTAITALCSLKFSAALVLRFGTRVPLVLGLSSGAVGLALLAAAVSNATGFVGLLPGMTLLGFGAGIALSPLLMASMRDVDPRDFGLASGILNTVSVMGTALGLAIALPAALTGGYPLAFLIGALAAGAAAVVALLFLRTPQC